MTEEPKRKVLVVDDDDDFRAAVMRFLAGHGWLTVGAADGAAAYALARRERFDVVLLDCWLPQASGFEVIHELARIDPALPVVMISAMGTDSTRREAIAQGAVTYVAKQDGAESIETALRRGVKEAEARRLALDAAEAPGDRPVHGTVLVVDDHEGFRRAAARLLKKAGFQVPTADSGTAALELIERGGIDAALIDLHLPDTNGLEVAQLVRTLHPEVMVAMISGEANLEEKRRSFEHGLMGCIEKSEHMERLAKVAEWLVRLAVAERKRLADELKPEPAPSRRRDEVRPSLARRGRRFIRSREAKTLAAGLILAIILIIVLFDFMTRIEMRRMRAATDPAAPAERSLTFTEMFERLEGYLRRDEERERRRGE